MKIKHGYTFSPNASGYEPVTDIFTPEGSSRIPGHKSEAFCEIALKNARKRMEETHVS